MTGGELAPAVVLPMRVLVTGSREWTDRGVIADALEEVLPPLVPPLVPPQHGSGWRPAVVVHGAADGADTIAAQAARLWGYSDEPHPVTREEYQRFGRAAPQIRNHRMVQLGADVCLAFPLGESPGTRRCMEFAARAGIPVRVFAPRGTDANPWTPEELRTMDNIVARSKEGLSTEDRFRLVRAMTRRGGRKG